MQNTRTALGLGALGLAAALPQAARAQSYVPVPFAKTNNIYTNLNQQFPHSGTGVPGSATGTANQTFLFNPATYTSPNAVAGANKTTGGATFAISSDASGHDFAEVNAPLVVPVNLAGVSRVSILVNGYNNPAATFTFTASGGVTETFSGVALHDFSLQGSPRSDSFTVNAATPDLFDQTAFQVTDTGAGGTGNSSNGAFATYGIDEDTFLLSSAFTSQTLQSVTITAQGSTPIVLGITALSAAPEPSAFAGLGLGVLGLGALTLRARKRGAAASPGDEGRGTRNGCNDGVMVAG